MGWFSWTERSFDLNTLDLSEIRSTIPACVGFPRMVLEIKRHKNVDWMKIAGPPALKADLDLGLSLLHLSPPLSCLPHETMISSEFKKFAATYHILLHATLFFLLVILFRGASFEIFKVSFTSISSAMMASAYLMCRNLSAYYGAADYMGIHPTARFYEVMAMLFGFLTLFFFLMNLFGFWGGIICLPISPPVVLLGLKAADLPWFGNVKASMDCMHGNGVKSRRIWWGS